MKSGWTDKKIEKLKKYMAKGLTTSEIGRKMDMSKNAVIGKIHRMGLNETIKKETPAKKTGLFKGLSIKKKAETKKASTPKKEEKAKPQKATAKKEDKTPELPLEANKKSPVKKTTKVESKPAKPKSKSEKSKNTTAFKLQDLQYNMCKWPLEEGDSEGNFLFCGCATQDKKQYCDKHLMEAYSRPEDKK